MLPADTAIVSCVWISRKSLINEANRNIECICNLHLHLHLYHTLSKYECAMCIYAHVHLCIMFWHLQLTGTTIPYSVRVLRKAAIISAHRGAECNWRIPARTYAYFAHLSRALCRFVVHTMHGISQYFRDSPCARAPALARSCHTKFDNNNADRVKARVHTFRILVEACTRPHASRIRIRARFDEHKTHAWSLSEAVATTRVEYGGVRSECELSALSDDARAIPIDSFKLPFAVQCF